MVLFVSIRDTQCLVHRISTLVTARLFLLYARPSTLYNRRPIGLQQRRLCNNIKFVIFLSIFCADLLLLSGKEFCSLLRFTFFTLNKKTNYILWQKCAQKFGDVFAVFLRRAKNETRIVRYHFRHETSQLVWILLDCCGVIFHPLQQPIISRLSSLPTNQNHTFRQTVF